MKDQAKVLSDIFREIIPQVQPGKTLLGLDSILGSLIQKYKAESVNKGYKPHFGKVEFPGFACWSVNNILAHGIPTDYILQEGDNLNIDMGIKYKGLCADAAIELPIGEIAPNTKKLINAAKQTLYAGIEEVRAGIPIFRLGNAMEAKAKGLGYKTNRQLIGHGIGTEMHEKPDIPNFRDYNLQFQSRFSGTLIAGQVICLEPQIAKHSEFGEVDSTGYNMKTDNGKRAAFFEHMVEVTETGYIILTDHFDEKLI